MKTTLKLISFTVLSVMALAGQSAWADLMTFDLTTGNSAVSGYAGDYAEVQVNLINSMTATITFTSLIEGGNIYLFGSQDAVAVNVDAGSWTVSNITGSNGGTGFTSGPLSNGNSGSEDGFGMFNQQISSFDGFGHSSDSISFTLTDNDAGGWSDAAAVLADNAGGSLAAAHIFVTASPANEANGALVTGYAGSGTDSPLPDGGSTMIMLGTAFIGLAKSRSWLARV